MATTIESLGDSAWLLRDLPAAPYRFVEPLSRVANVLEAAPSYETIAVFFDPLNPPDREAVLNALEESTNGQAGRAHEIPVCYEMGEDLASVAQALSLSIEEVIALHTSATYTCWAVGFRPGFAFLGWLPERLTGIRRLPQPRVRVPEGSVAIADRQTGVYPAESPGGWSILGRTPLKMVDRESNYFPIAAGDTVRFKSVSQLEFDRLLGQRL